MTGSSGTRARTWALVTSALMIVVACATEFPPSEATDPPLESATAIPTAEPTEATPVNIGWLENGVD